MAKTVFREWKLDQGELFPPSFLELVPSGHLVHFIRKVVAEDLDLSAIYGEYESALGQPPYDPRLMVALLLYGCCRGIYSSRKLEIACEERLDFRALVGSERPDHSTICEFRTQHWDAISELFVQVLQLCRDAGMAKLGHVSLDGTKVAANASKHAAMSYGRMKDAEPELAKKVEEWRTKADEANTGARPAQVSADAGYCSEENLAALEARGIDAYVATGRQKHGTASATGGEEKKQGPLATAMREKLRARGWESPYRLRKQTVEPVFGQIKEARGFRRFLHRGLRKVRAEWRLVCTAHNLLKLAARRAATSAAATQAAA